MIAVLRYLELGSFAASTRSKRSIEDQQVKATVVVAFSILTQSPNSDLANVTTFDQTFVVPIVKQGQPVKFDSFEGTATLPANQTAVMPEPMGQPATIALSVAETGEGVGEFAAFDEIQFRASADIITQALGNVIKLKILPNQPP
jgi:hypothetical protein